jgi:hypothetical protein
MNAQTTIGDPIVKVIGIIAIVFAFFLGFFAGVHYERKQTDKFHLRIDENGFHLEGRESRK